MLARSNTGKLCLRGIRMPKEGIGPILSLAGFLRVESPVTVAHFGGGVRM